MKSADIAATFDAVFSARIPLFFAWAKRLFFLCGLTEMKMSNWRTGGPFALSRTPQPMTWWNISRRAVFPSRTARRPERILRAYGCGPIQRSI